jgi:hypothetical protein
MVAMTPDGDKNRAITFERVASGLTVIIAALGYLLPSDAAHPRRFDILSKTLTVPFWLAFSTVSATIAITVLITKWLLRNKSQSGEVIAFSSYAPAPDTLYRPNATAPTFTPEISAQIPPVLTVRIQTVVYETEDHGLTIVITNRGGSEARHILLDDIRVGPNTVRFSGSIESLKAGESSGNLIPCVIEFKERSNHNIAFAMYRGIIDEPSEFRERYEYEGGADFYDIMGKKWRATWTFNFFPHRYQDYCDDPTGITGDLAPHLTVSRMSTLPVDQP